MSLGRLRHERTRVTGSRREACRRRGQLHLWTNHRRGLGNTAWRILARPTGQRKRRRAHPWRSHARVRNACPSRSRAGWPVRLRANPIVTLCCRPVHRLGAELTWRCGSRCLGGSTGTLSNCTRHRRTTDLILRRRDGESHDVLLLFSGEWATCAAYSLIVLERPQSRGLRRGKGVGLPVKGVGRRVPIDLGGSHLENIPRGRTLSLIRRLC